MSDAFSRLLWDIMELPSVPTGEPRIQRTTKSARAYVRKVTESDPWVEVGSRYLEYMSIIHDIESFVDTSSIPEDSELKAVEGQVSELLVLTLKNGNNIISRGNGEVYIPKGERQRIVSLIHQTHLAERMMLEQAGFFGLI